MRSAPNFRVLVVHANQLRWPSDLCAGVSPVTAAQPDQSNIDTVAETLRRGSLVVGCADKPAVRSGRTNGRNLHFAIMANPTSDGF